MFGMVKNSLHVFWPPIVQESPLFSVATWNIFVAKPPLPAVKLSPIAPTISISPGRSWCTDVGGVALLLPGPLTSQKNGSSLLNCFCNFCNAIEEAFYYISAELFKANSSLTLFFKFVLKSARLSPVLPAKLSRNSRPCLRWLIPSWSKRVTSEWTNVTEQNIK